MQARLLKNNVPLIAPRFKRNILNRDADLNDTFFMHLQKVSLQKCACPIISSFK